MSDEDLAMPTSAEARKRRVERRKHGKSAADIDDGVADTELEEVVKRRKTGNADPLSREALAKIKGSKEGARYLPSVPMTREELTLWRKEQVCILCKLYRVFSSTMALACCSPRVCVYLKASRS